MFCTRCGTALQPGAAACANCGAATGPVATAVELAEERLPGQLKVVGILWIVYSALHLLAGAALFVVAAVVLPTALRNEPEAAFVPPLVLFISFLLLVPSLFGVLAGWGVMARKPWARILVLVLAFLVLLSIPFGTALGIYTLVVLLPSDAGRAYDRLAEQAAGGV